MATFRKNNYIADLGAMVVTGLGVCCTLRFGCVLYSQVWVCAVLSGLGVCCTLRFQQQQYFGMCRRLVMAMHCVSECNTWQLQKRLTCRIDCNSTSGGFEAFLWEDHPSGGIYDGV